MTAVATVCLLLLAACIVPCLYRLATGPHALDRLLAFDLIGVLLAAITAVHSIVQQSWFYLEISMGLAVLSLVGTVAIAHFVDRERVF
jgi:multisubunit Na+/H+ antiporter MnhF subunit